MIGMNARTGQALDGHAHLVQSIADLLTTPLGTRIARRDYGSALPELIDAPFNAATRMRLLGAAATALLRWEPRLRLTRLGLSAEPMPGVFVLELEGLHLTPGAASPTALSIPLHFAPSPDVGAYP